MGRTQSAERPGSGRQDRGGRSQGRRARTRRLAARRGLGTAASAERPPAAPHPPCPLLTASAALGPSAALRLRARHRGRVLLRAAGQWARRAEPGRPMGASLGPGAGGPGRGGAGSPAPRPPPPSFGRSGGGLCTPICRHGADGGSFYPPPERSEGLRTAVPARLRKAGARRGEGRSAEGPPRLAVLPPRPSPLGLQTAAPLSLPPVPLRGPILRLPP